MEFSSHVRAVEAWFTPRRLRAAAWVMLAGNLLTTAGWLLTSRGGIDRYGQPVGGDFVLFHAAARLTWLGRPLAAYDPAAFLAAQRALVPGTPAGLYWTYPPPFQLLIAPLGALPFPIALAVWTAAGAALLHLSLRTATGRRPALLLFAAAPAVWTTAWQGQTGLFVAAALAYGLTRLDRRPWLAGAALGVLVCKPQFAVLIPLLLLGVGRLKSAAAAALTAAALAGASLAVFGPELWRAFLSGLSGVADGVTAGTLPWTKIPSIYSALLRLGMPRGPALALHGCVALVTAGVTLAAWRRPGPAEAKAGLAALAAVIVTPYAFNYDLAVTLMALAATVGRRSEAPPPVGALLMLAPLILLPGLMVLLAGVLRVQTAPVMLLLGFWGMWRVCTAEGSVVAAPAVGAAGRTAPLPA